MLLRVTATKMADVDRILVQLQAAAASKGPELPGVSPARGPGIQVGSGGGKTSNALGGLGHWSVFPVDPPFELCANVGAPPGTNQAHQKSDHRLLTQ